MPGSEGLEEQWEAPEPRLARCDARTSPPLWPSEWRPQIRPPQWPGNPSCCVPLLLVDDAIDLSSTSPTRG